MNKLGAVFFQKSLGNGHVNVANTKYNIALLYRRQGNTIQARNLFREAAAVYTAVYGANHSETIDALDQAKKWHGSGSNEVCSLTSMYSLSPPLALHL